MRRRVVEQRGEHARFTFEWASKSKSAVAAFLTASPAVARSFGGTCRKRIERDPRMFPMCVCSIVAVGLRSRFLPQRRKSMSGHCCCPSIATIFFPRKCPSLGERGKSAAANVTGTCQEVDSSAPTLMAAARTLLPLSSLSVTNPKVGPFFTVAAAAAASVSLFPLSLNRIVTT